jgi:hypothetical protein
VIAALTAALADLTVRHPGLRPFAVLTRGDFNAFRHDLRAEGPGMYIHREPDPSVYAIEWRGIRVTGADTPRSYVEGRSREGDVFVSVDLPTLEAT